MIEFIKNLFSDDNREPEPHKVDLAAACLLVEIMRADHHIEESERATLKGVMKSLFRISDDELENLLGNAEQTNAAASDLFQFTEVVHTNFTVEQKFRLLKGLWKVALSDQQLDKYEEHMIRRIADLLYMSHDDFIRAKIEARDS